MSDLAVVARDTNRLDVFGVAHSGDGFVVSHKGWDGVSWHPSLTGWESLGESGGSIAVASWGPSRLDLITLAPVPGQGYEVHHKAWTGSSWSPSQTGWNNLGGDIPGREIAMVAWGPNRLDIFALWSDWSMYHRAWSGSSWSQWSPLGGEFWSGPAVASWGPNRLDIFGVGKSLGMWHKAWLGDHWHPANPSWQGLGGVFGDAKLGSFSPGVASWGPDRLDLFGMGKSWGMWHKAWTGSNWHPSGSDWQPLGGYFRGSEPAVASWGPNRLDIFGMGDDFAIYHKAWLGDHWHPANPSWENLGGEFSGPPSVVSWGPDRLDIFAVGSGAQNFQMCHKAWNGSYWEPSVTDWQLLGGDFAPEITT